MSRWPRIWQDDGREVAEFVITSDIDCLSPELGLHISGWAYGQTIDQRIRLVSQPQRLGGERWFALCPRSGRLCISLVLPPCEVKFASVRGWNVAYASQREIAALRAHRAFRRAVDRRDRLTKYTRKPTRQKAEEVVRERARKAWLSTDRWLAVRP